MLLINRKLFQVILRVYLNLNIKFLQYSLLNKLRIGVSN